MSCPVALLIGARGSRFIGGMHHGTARWIAGQGDWTSIHFFLQSRQLPFIVRSEIGSRGFPVMACTRRRRPAENPPLRDCDARSEGLSLC